MVRRPVALERERDRRNLLAAPGFEEEDSAADQAQALGAGYEKQVQTLLESVEAAAKSANPAEALPALGKQVDALAALVTERAWRPTSPASSATWTTRGRSWGCVRGCCCAVVRWRG